MVNVVYQSEAYQNEAYQSEAYQSDPDQSDPEIRKTTRKSLFGLTSDPMDSDCIVGYLIRKLKQRGS
jgi:hypothetical protein